MHEILADISKCIYKLCGLEIKAEKHYLIQQRLMPVMDMFGCADYSELRQRLRENTDWKLRESVIAAITTNETAFFRDGHPFNAFRNRILPLLAERIRQSKKVNYQNVGPRVRIWSAASSTGQEPFSVAILIQDYLDTARPAGVDVKDFGILATDISTRALEKAKKGEFNELDISRGLDPSLRARNFELRGDMWTVREQIRKMVEFRRLNLVEPIQALGTFDVIFCRNVLIYFDTDTKTKIFRQIYSMMGDESYLILGSTESVYGLDTGFESVRMDNSVVYKKTPHFTGCHA